MTTIKIFSIFKLRNNNNEVNPMDINKFKEEIAKMPEYGYKNNMFVGQKLKNTVPMTTNEMKTEIQRIIDDKNKKEKLLFLLVEQCDAVENDCKALYLLDSISKKMDVASAKFSSLLNEYKITVDSSYEDQWMFWKEIETLWNEIDNWRLNFIKENINKK